MIIVYYIWYKMKILNSLLYEYKCIGIYIIDIIFLKYYPIINNNIYVLSKIKI